MDVDSTLAWNIKSLSGVDSYPFSKPNDAPLPAVAYAKVSGNSIDLNHGGAGTMWRARFQLTHTASDVSTLHTMVKAIRIGILGNQVFPAGCTEAGLEIERMEAEDIFVCIKDYFICWKE